MGGWRTFWRLSSYLQVEKAVRSIFVAMLAALIAGCPSSNASDIDEIVIAYDVPGTMTGFCRWSDARLGPLMTLRGTFRFGDEHAPSWFEAEHVTDLPPALQKEFIVLAFRKGQAKHFSQLFGDPLVVSGRIATGNLACRGNFSTETFSATFLIDRASPNAAQ